MKKKPKLTPLEQKLLIEAAAAQDLRLGTPKSEGKPLADLPLFSEKEKQQSLF